MFLTPEYHLTHFLFPEIGNGLTFKRKWAWILQGLTSAEKHSEMVTDNPLFSKKATSSEIMSLQQRAEAVAQSLATIETQEAEYASSSDQQQTGYSKERLIDTVKTHLSQVQRSLSARLTPPLTPSLTPRQSFVHSASPPRQGENVTPFF